jgi:hypothetical protein
VNQESGIRNQETGNRNQETGNRKQETGSRKQESAIRDRDAGVSERLSDPVTLRSLGDEEPAFCLVPEESRFFAALRMTRVQGSLRCQGIAEKYCGQADACTSTVPPPASPPRIARS